MFEVWSHWARKVALGAKTVFVWVVVEVVDVMDVLVDVTEDTIVRILKGDGQCLSASFLCGLAY